MNESAHIPDEDLDPSAVDLTPYRGVTDQDGWVQDRLTAEAIERDRMLTFLDGQINASTDEDEIETLTRMRESIERLGDHTRPDPTELP